MTTKNKRSTRGHNKARQKLDKLCRSASRAARNRQYTRAISGYLEAVRLAPDQPQATRELLQLCRELGETPDRFNLAVGACQQLLEYLPDQVECRNILGGIFYLHGRSDLAKRAFDAALQLDPDNAESHEYSGYLQRAENRFDLAEYHFCRAVTLTKRRRVQVEYSSPGSKLGDPKSDQAGAIFDRAALVQQLDTKIVSLRNQWVDTLSVQGDQEEAIRLCRENLVLRPDDVFTLNQMVQLLGDDPLDPEIITRLQSATHSEKHPVEQRTVAHFALGKYFDHAGRSDLAFRHFQQGNQLAGGRFDHASHSSLTRAMIETFDGPMLNRGPRASIRSESPVFVLGMPRSGTSLVEQILASHDEVYGAGELRQAGQVMFDTLCEINDGRTDASIRTIRDMTVEQSDRAARQYLDFTQNLAPNARRIVDKLPQNFAQLGFIAMMLPEARVIHCRRHPLDVTLSCFATYFSHSQAAMGFSCDLVSIAKYYVEYERIMQHWASVLPLMIVEVRYDDLINRQEQTSRRLIRQCGLDWSDACLRFHKTRRPVSTASKHQVRKPIYRSSIDRWRQYEVQLEPAIKILAQSIQNYEDERATTDQSTDAQAAADTVTTPHMTISTAIADTPLYDQLVSRYYA